MAYTIGYPGAEEVLAWTETPRGYVPDIPAVGGNGGWGGYEDYRAPEPTTPTGYVPNIPAVGGNGGWWDGGDYGAPEPTTPTGIDELWAQYQAQMAGYPTGFSKPSFEAWVGWEMQRAQAQATPYPWTTSATTPTGRITTSEQARQYAERKKAEALITTVTAPGAGGDFPAMLDTQIVKTETKTEGGWVFWYGYNAAGQIVDVRDLGRATEAAKAEPLPTGAFGTYEEANKASGTSGYIPIQTTGGYWILQPPEQPRIPESISPYQQADVGLRQAQLAQEAQHRQAQLAQEYQIWQAQLAHSQAQLTQESQIKQAQLAHESQLAQAQRTQASQLAQAQLAHEAQLRQQSLAAEKEQRLATLRAQPASWLEYAALAGQAPAIQPWMLPLMPQQYAGTVAGAPIPGWSAGAPTMAELPELTTPSRQYQARMGPVGLQQYAGYERARTGMTPEEQQFRLWSQAPPSGSFRGLQWQR